MNTATVCGWRRWLLLLILALQTAGCAPIQPPAPVVPAVRNPVAGTPAGGYEARVATTWFKLIAQLARRSPGFSPPVAARLFAYAGITLYEAVLPGMPGYQSLAGQLREMPAMPWPQEPGDYHWPSAANAALAAIARSFLPAIGDLPQREIAALEARLDEELRAQAGEEMWARSSAYGRTVAEAVYAWSQSDGGHEGYLRNVDPGFILPAGEGIWLPTGPDFSPPLQPWWGENRTMALLDGGECAPPPPPAYSADPESQFYKEAYEVYETVGSLSREQLEIALFWADDAGTTVTPPGHSLSIGTQALELEGSTLATAAELYAKLGIALNDSFIACWKTKYIYNTVRPITYIQQHIDPTWNTPELTDPVTTPPFPEYTSGHSVESRAAAEILTATFGDHYRFTDITNTDRGLPPRTFPSFYAAAAEAAVSRLYAGIHYRSAIEQGLAQGGCIARRVLAIQFRVP